MRISVGIDLVRVEDVRASIVTFGDRFITRVFMPSEVAYARSTADKHQALAARFAAKEATFKALGLEDEPRDFRAIEVIRESNGAPRLILFGSIKALADARKVTELVTSLTHTSDYASAVVIAYGEG